MYESDNLDNLVEELQQKILSDVRERYSQTAVDHWQNPRNCKRITNPDGYARVRGSCGDSMEMFIVLSDDNISDCGFQTDGCGPSIICGSVVTELVRNKSAIEARACMSPAGIIDIIGGLPPEDEHCAQLASMTMMEALNSLCRPEGSG